MTDISLAQFSLVHNAFSLMIAVTGVVLSVCLIHRKEVHPRYRVSVTLVGLMAMVGTYSYYRLFESWNRSFSIMDGEVKSTGHPFEDAYRYGEWLFTAPFILVAILLLLGTNSRQMRSFVIFPVLAAVAMVAAAAAGKLNTTSETRLFCVLLSFIPFFTVLYHLYVSAASAIHRQPASVRQLVVGARFAIVLAWSSFQLVCAMPLLNFSDTTALVAAQLGLVGADLVALLGAGMLVFTVAMRKAVEEGQTADPLGPLQRPIHGPGQRVIADVVHYG